MLALLLVLMLSKPTQDGFSYQDRIGGPRGWHDAKEQVASYCSDAEKEACRRGCELRYDVAYHKGARVLAAVSCGADVYVDPKGIIHRDVSCTCQWGDEGYAKHMPL